jgi:tripartite-type tricarboxylate transporter receptor subunit TctC
LNAALARVFARPDVVAKLVEMGIEPMPLGTAAYAAHVKSEKDKWFRVVKAAGTRLD